MFKISTQLSESLETARAVLSNEEFKTYASGVGHVLVDIMYGVLYPVFATNPSLEPKDWKK